MTAGSAGACAVGPEMRLAAIDIGTVTCRLLVADVRQGQVAPVAREYEVTNLGEGVDASGVISAAALARVEAAVRRFIQVRDAHSSAAHPVEKTVVMSTSAARDARNADEFAAMIASCGLELQVISGQREAELTFAGATMAARPGTPVAVVDVGGGSTEVSFGVAGEGIGTAHSFDVGCRRMTERFFHHDPPTPEEVEAAHAWACEQFAAWNPDGPSAGTKAEAFATERCVTEDSGMECVAQASACDLPVTPQQPRELIAVAGTATSAIAMEKELAVYDPAQIHGACLSLSRLEALFARLAAMTEAQRERVTGLDPRRAPVITAGLLILICAMRTFGFSAFTASESDILQGMLSWAATGPARS